MIHKCYPRYQPCLTKNIKLCQVKWFFPLFCVKCIGSLCALFFILISLIGFPTGIISAHCIYATNVCLWSHLEQVSQVAIEIVTFRLSGGADYCNLLYFGPLKILGTICGQKIYSRVAFIYLHSWRLHFSHYRFHHIHGIQDKHLRVDAEGHRHICVERCSSLGWRERLAPHKACPCWRRRSFSWY